MDIFAALKKDHAKVKGLFEELEATTERGVKKREELFEKINEELTLHTELEEKLFYPRLRGEKETHELTVEALEEHGLVKRLLKELEAAPKGTEEWAAKAKVMMENVRHHIKEEESQLFKQAREVIGSQEAKELAERAEEFKSEVNAAD
jgi:hemerythrin-like domain-containing protein